RGITGHDRPRPAMPFRLPWRLALLVILFVQPLFVYPMTATAQTMLEAAERGDSAGVERLIAAAAPIDQPNPAVQTPLLLAVQNSHGAAALRLIDAGANINAQAANRDTPWLLAGALGRTEMLRRMLPKGPDFAIRNRFGGNALIPAC